MARPGLSGRPGAWIDLFAREDGYAMVTVGDPGSGTSFKAKQNFIRTLAREPDRVGVILEPLNDWHGVADALGGRHVTVGGTLGLNPLEIRRPTNETPRPAVPTPVPLKKKRNRVGSFFTTYFSLRDVQLGDRRTTLRSLRTALRSALTVPGCLPAVAGCRASGLPPTAYPRGLRSGGCSSRHDYAACRSLRAGRRACGWLCHFTRALSLAPTARS